MEGAMRAKRFALFLSFVMFAGCMKEQPRPAVDTAKSAEQIQQVFARWKTAFEAKDVNGVMAMYAPGATLTAYDVVPPLQFKGADAYTKDYGAFFAQFDGPIRVELSDDHVVAGADTGFAYGLERLTGKMTNGTPVDMWLRYTEGLKLIDGQWRVVHEHISVPVDLDTGKARLDLKP
jgi:ketosteroid isomerase-like protein